MEPSGTGSEWKKIHLAAPSLLLISFSSLLSFSSASQIVSLLFTTSLLLISSLLLLIHSSEKSPLPSPILILAETIKCGKAVLHCGIICCLSLHFPNKISNFKSDFFVPSFQMHLAGCQRRLGGLCINNDRGAGCSRFNHLLGQFLDRPSPHSP